MASDKYVLQMRSITKRFPGVLALNRVDLELRSEEVLALLGENGAGKSTLIKILSGAYQPDSGEILIDGEVQTYKNPHGANKKGLSVIYQELNYLNDLTVAENIYLNRLPKTKFGFVDWKTLHSNAKKILESLDIKLDTQNLMRNLSVAEKQLVEIGKALSQNIKILVMDEPTAALSEKEVEHLFSLILKLRNEGKCIIFISHRLDEIFYVADRVQVLRDGERVALFDIADTDREKLVQLMVGRQINTKYQKRKIDIKDVILSVNNVNTSFLKNISFQVRKGEILGIFGLMGAGQTDLAECLFGNQSIRSGEIEINGQKVEFKNSAQAIKNGIAYLTAERKKDGLVLIASVKDNILLSSLDRYENHYKINVEKERKIANKWKDKLNIKCPNVDTTVDTLSGGNQQKVVLSKWLNTRPKVLILNEPTRGIDVGAKSEIYDLMEDFCEEDVGIIMISSDLPEVLQLSDRVLVLYEGCQMNVFNRDELSQELLMKSAIGGI